MHGIDNAFGIIGSAFMPISDLFPQAGIMFWDVAHEGNGAIIADGCTRTTGKMAMHRPERPGHHEFRDVHQDRLLEPHADAAGDAAGRQQDDRPGRLPGSRADGDVPRLRLLPGRSPRSPRIAETLNRVILKARPFGWRADQRAPRFLDAGHRRRPADADRIRAPVRRRQRGRGSREAASEASFPSFFPAPASSSAKQFPNAWRSPRNCRRRSAGYQHNDPSPVRIRWLAVRSATTDRRRRWN